jgi:hypothetical protein
MAKATAFFSFVVILESLFLNVSWADKHIPALPDGDERSFVLTERGEMIGPEPRSEDLSQHTEQPSMKWLNLIHTDPHHLPGIAPHHSSPYRNFQAPDGAALMFNWTFDKR